MPSLRSLDLMSSVIPRHNIAARVGRIRSLSANMVAVSGLSDVASVGHRVSFESIGVQGEVLSVSEHDVNVLPDGPLAELRIGQPVRHLGEVGIYPDDSWLGRVIDGEGNPLDGQPLVDGAKKVALFNAPPAAAERRGFGARLDTGYTLFNTMLPIVRGQRIGLFSGSGVGKSSLMGAFASEMEADVVVIGLIGERGREVNHFVRQVLGKKGLERSVIVASTSEKSALARRRAAFTAMAVAEHFRDEGRNVLLMVDSITRLAEAHREIASTAGEPAAMRGFPPSMVNLLAGFAERAGPGKEGQGDITAILTVLVSGSDMEEPVADTLRGLLDGHVVLSRTIAERGRFPAVDVLKSVSRSLPDAATAVENDLIGAARRVLSTYEDSEIMVRSGLYQPGANAEVDTAVALFPGLDAFAAQRTDGGFDASFEALAGALQAQGAAALA
ncbi:MAG: FliI/YscN family ATPase [Silicimonas sp.]|nr:FliI/YscN family ATPase [Silicimonas sp.]